MTKDSNNESRPIILFTIGFAKKTAREFFATLKKNQVKTLIDVRLNNISQLAGFTKKNDLEFFLKELCDIEYFHRPILAPTKNILDAYKKKEISWEEYENRYLDLLSERQVATSCGPHELNMSCLLCSEPKADNCHRRLLAEYFKKSYDNIVIKHL
jgi:uncharacterized protein (DUF488 family)